MRLFSGHRTIPGIGIRGIVSRGRLLSRKPRRRALGPAIYVPRCTTVLNRRKGFKDVCWAPLPGEYTGRGWEGQHVGPCARCAEILATRQRMATEVRLPNEGGLA